MTFWPNQKKSGALKDVRMELTQTMKAIFVLSMPKIFSRIVSKMKYKSYFFLFIVEELLELPAEDFDDDL